MKTKTAISAISLALILVGAVALQAKDPGNRAYFSDKTQISYLVTISHPALAEPMLTGYLLVMTDAKGHVVVPAVRVLPGVFSYLIRENGPVAGSRTFKLVRAAGTEGPGVHYKDATLGGPFSCGYTYEVILQYITESVSVEPAIDIR